MLTVRTRIRGELHVPIERKKVHINMGPRRRSLVVNSPVNFLIISTDFLNFVGANLSHRTAEACPRFNCIFQHILNAVMCVIVFNPVPAVPWCLRVAAICTKRTAALLSAKFYLPCTVFPRILRIVGRPFC